MTAAPSRHLLLTADAVGGVWSYVVDLAAGLQRRGAAVTIATLGPRPSAKQCEGLTADLIATDHPLDWTAETAEALHDAAQDVAAIARRIRADSIHLHAPAYAGFADWPTPVVAVVHSCVATWWSVVRGGPLPADLTWRAEAVARGIARADAVIAPSHGFAAMLRSSYGDGWKLHVVHNGRSWPAPAPRVPRRPHVFTAGRLWDEGKDLRTLDAAAGIAGCSIRAAGPVTGPNDTALKSCNLTLLGTLDAAAMARELAGASVFASAARYEPFGLAVLEAAQAGLPLVLSDIPTFRELWDEAAQFVPCGDAAGFAAALQVVLRDPALAAHLGHAARERARSYGSDAMVERTLAIHEALLRERFHDDGKRPASSLVTPAQAGVQAHGADCVARLDSRLRGNDEKVLRRAVAPA